MLNNHPNVLANGSSRPFLVFSHFGHGQVILVFNRHIKLPLHRLARGSVLFCLSRGAASKSSHSSMLHDLRCSRIFETA